MIDSPWMNKHVRVVGEGPGEGKRGQVRSVLRVVGVDPAEYALTVCTFTETRKEVGGIFQVRHARVEEERQIYEPDKDFKLDYRTLTDSTRQSLAASLGIDDVEYIIDNRALEIGTIHAMLLELQLRFEPPNTLLVPPSVAVTYDENMPTDHGGEVAKFLAEIAEAQHIFVVIHSESPSHFTFLHIERMEDHETPEPRPEFRIEFKDSLKSAPATARAAATRFLRGANLIKTPAEAPEPSNVMFQDDGWSCGLWATRWIERSLRERRAERRMPPPYIKSLCVRTNEFIDRLKKAKPKAKAQPKAKDKPKNKVPRVSEPVHETFDHALAAGQLCTKCIGTKAGTKGCRACMGEWFEEIRKKHFGIK